MKVGDRVVLEGSDVVFLVRTIDEARQIANLESIYDGKRQQFRVGDLKLTAKNPVVLVETYGGDWCNNVTRALEGSKVRFKSYPVERSRDIRRFFVDAKKLTAAKNVLDNFYKKGLDKQTENESNDAFEHEVFEDDGDDV
jgi:hypothetical protein